MPNTNNNPSSGGGRKAGKRRRTVAVHGGSTSSSPSSQHGQHQVPPSSVPGTDSKAHAMASNNQPGLAEGDKDYPPPDGTHHLGHDEETINRNDDEVRDAPPGNDGSWSDPNMVDDNAGQYWDRLSRYANQGSNDTAPSTVNGDISHNLQDEWYSDVENQFLNGIMPWSAENVVIHAEGVSPHGAPPGANASYHYPEWTELQVDDDDVPETPPRRG